MKRFSKYIVLLVIMIIAGFIICSSFFGDIDQYQYLNSIDYHVEMQRDGSMRVTETWDIDVKNTNTLFKTFSINKYKYGDITDVKVTDLQSGKNFTQIYEEMYHVTNGCYYGLKTNSSTFEIAWGVGMDNSTGNRKFQISYTVTDVVTDYNDVQEIYWQFLAEGQNAVPAKKVTGTVVLPESVKNIDNLKVWGHGQLNGIIEKASNNTVKFELANLNPGSRLEIRVTTQEKIFSVNENKIRPYSYLNQIVNEEQKWAEEADEKSIGARNFYIFLGIIYALLLIYFITRIVKYNKINKQKDDGIIYNHIDYFRDIPREDATPAEACYLYNFTKDRISTKQVQNQAVSSTILDLCLKKVISLRTEGKEVYVSILKDKQGLSKDEQEVYSLLYYTSQDRTEFPISDLNLFAKNRYNKYSQIINNIVNSARNRLYELNLVDKAQEKQYSKCKNAKSLKNMVSFIYAEAYVTYLISLIPMFKVGIALTFGMSFQTSWITFLICLLPLVAVAIYSWHIKARIGDKIAVLTQAGADEKEKWEGLSRYMKDYSLLNEKRVLDLVLWEKYLVYATAFGISDKVIEQMKASYPEVFVRESWDENKINEYPVIYFSTYPIYNGIIVANAIDNIINNVGKAYKTSLAEISAHSSSSHGGGGGFSGGGGGRRWSEAGMGGR